VAFVAPALVTGGWVSLLAAACVTGIMIGTRSYILAILGGVAVIWLLRG